LPVQEINLRAYTKDPDINDPTTLTTAPGWYW